MDIEALDQVLVKIVEKKNILSQLNYNDKNYDQVEEELHDLEDDFVEQYGEYLEDILADVHDELCPDNDVLLPIAYLANKYVKEEDKGKVVYHAADGGVLVDVDEYPDKLTRLVLVPKPTRLMLQIGNHQEEQVWIAK
ncbi:hypothetical protein OKW21_000103 [Catalinimonas alkaloidigena]|uniref:hypothetical protein n=1 Tax=Catalinimonas alkaloidigena TaxID=1075417 RepID=UPI002406ECB1|nr:hypothetical protein [Catalinimonas alkaloidigena]MDF9794840.1 hypothetical protein [Catalinimonas alkaloidigena]